MSRKDLQLLHIQMDPSLLLQEGLVQSGNTVRSEGISLPAFLMRLGHLSAVHSESLL